MSFRDATKPQDLEPERLKPDQGTPTLNRSAEAEQRATPLCTGQAPDDLARERILAWLAEGVREVTWALCSFPREHWATSTASQWPALRHVRHLALTEAHQLLPSVRRALGESVDEAAEWSSFELERADTSDVVESEDVKEVVRALGETRFELLQRLEAAPDDAWTEHLNWQLLKAHQHELEHLAAIWKLALNWGRPSRTPAPGVPLHPADRLEESH